MKQIGEGTASSRGRLKRRTLEAKRAIQQEVAPQFKVGEAITMTGKQRAIVKNNTDAGGGQHKPVKENKTTTDVQLKTPSAKSAANDLPVSPAPQLESRDLMPPHEWAAMLRHIESEVVPAGADGAVVTANDLWEKLSNTRSLKKRPVEDAEEDNRSSAAGN